MDTFRDVYTRHHCHVYRFALFLTGDPARAEDLAAETFARAWTVRGRIRQDTIRAYLLTIARNLHRDQLRSSRPVVALDDTIVDPAPPPDVRTQQVLQLREVRTRLRAIARGDRRALLLYVLKEMSYGEIATALGISVPAVKSRIFRARAALATPLSPRRQEHEP